MISIITRYGHVLTTAEVKAYKTLKKLIEDEESFAREHGMADAFRSYFTEVKGD